MSSGRSKAVTAELEADLSGRESWEIPARLVAVAKTGERNSGCCLACGAALNRCLSCGEWFAAVHGAAVCSIRCRKALERARKRPKAAQLQAKARADEMLVQRESESSS